MPVRASRSSWLNNGATQHRVAIAQPQKSLTRDCAALSGVRHTQAYGG